MRVLVVSFVFPPHNIIGAVRIGKTAKYLWRAGHDVRVLTARDLDIDPSLELEIPAENVVATRWADVDRPYRILLSARNRIKQRLSTRTSSPTTDASNNRQPQGFGSVGPQSESRRLSWRIRLLYTNLVHMPDSAVGWRRHALSAGRSLAARWKPDVILASGAPWTSLIVARALSAQLRVPWVADMRDLWSGNHTTFVSHWRKRTIDAWYEAHVLRTASVLVTVSEPLAAKLRKRYPDKRIEVVLNGFDADDYALGSSAVTNELADRHRSPGYDSSTRTSATLHLVYTGEINRDMLPLLDGLRLLSEDAKDVQLEIIGPQSSEVRARYTAIAKRYGLDKRCLWREPVSHAEASRIQQAADVLVLLMHESPNDAGVYTGKLFEYVGARRPILLAGATSGVAAELIRDRGLGKAEFDPELIAAHIRNWLREKRKCGRVAPPSGAFIEDLTRAAQTRRYAAILESAVAR